MPGQLSMCLTLHAQVGQKCRLANLWLQRQSYCWLLVLHAKLAACLTFLGNMCMLCGQLMSVKIAFYSSH